MERERRRRDTELAEYNGTPYISRTPFGGADLETPLPGYRQREQDEKDEKEIKRRKIDTSRGLDVSLPSGSPPPNVFSENEFADDGR